MPRLNKKDSLLNPSVIDPVIDRFTDRAHFVHYHVTVYQGNERLVPYLRNAIREEGRPVLTFGGQAGFEYFPEAEYPGEAMPYVVQNAPSGHRVFARLDMLPVRYFHANAWDGGLDESAEFMRNYNGLIKGMIRDIRGAGISTPESEELISDPSIFWGFCRATGIKEPSCMLKPMIERVMNALQIPPEAFVGVRFVADDNCIESFPPSFDYAILVPLMRELGGWLDYRGCNFTTTGKTSDGKTLAIVHNGNLSGEEAFVKAVHEAFVSGRS